MNITYSFFITLIASFSTLIGTLFIFKKYKNINNVITSCLSFSSSVMLTISVFDLFPNSIKLFNLNYNLFITIMLFLIFFILGALLILFINKILPQSNKLYKVGLITMIGLILHNIPEGILTFITSSYDKKMGISLAVAICMHNIPEGIAISIPIYYSTNSKIKAILYTFIASLSELLGAFITYLFLYDYVNDILIAILLSFVCGIMSYIAIVELIAKTIKNKKLFILFFILGIIFMIFNI